jgi:DNA-binding NarL/FixJ family response regulator
MRVLIIAENAVAAEGIRRGLRHAPSCKVLGYANGRIPCAAIVADARPDIVVVDDMRDRSAALARIQEARDAIPEGKLLLLSVTMDRTWLAEASAAGIDGAIAKQTDHPASIGVLVREVAAGNVYHAFAGAAVQPNRTSLTDVLTARELEILRLVAAGLSNGRIAGELYVAEQTVKFHLSNIYRKLGIANRTEASHYAHLHGLVQVPTTSRADSVRVAA